MEFVLLAVDQLANGLAHLLNQEVVQLRVEVVAGVLSEATDGVVGSLEVLFDDSDYGLLHLLFEDVVLSLGVDLVEELFLHLVELHARFLLSHVLVALHVVHLLLEHVVELLRQRLHCQGHLLSEVVARVFAVGPSDKLLDRHDLVWLGFGLLRVLGDHCLVKSDFNLDVSLGLFENLVELFFFDFFLLTFFILLLHNGRASLEEHSLGALG
mmetsp:Transcript_22914/g.35245  ORF Transcript_22914/g.35245 Transcript_22914/m.35245 type:complete len:212 (-) Transcript_22914:917-1552(-)